ncbi:unnamed protein product [marine sediment metagenome]|uniref:Uncharacterized protein n=1 Tax=marine sediment metagenome TaxID=412755 RepID=X0X6P7_9ZZZZ
MIKQATTFVLFSMLMIMAGPAYSSGAAHIFVCEEGKDATEEKLEAAAAKWLKAARSMKGGAKFDAYIYYPSAANLKKGDLLFVVVAPSHAAWGTFWDNYKDSPAERADMVNPDLVVCPSSNLFEVVKIK